MVRLASTLIPFGFPSRVWFPEFPESRPTRGLETGKPPPPSAERPWFAYAPRTCQEAACTAQVARVAVTAQNADLLPREQSGSIYRWLQPRPLPYPLRFNSCCPAASLRGRVPSDAFP